MNWTIRKKMILAIVAMALLPFILGVIIIEGSLFERIERSVDENGMFPSYEKAEAQKKMFLTLVKEQIREDEEGLDGHKLNYFDSNSLSKLLGFYVEMDDMEIYRSEWLGNQDIEPIIVDDIENTYDYEGNLGLFDQAEILTLDHTYNIYTIYNYDNFVSIITKYIAYLVIVAVSLFALIAFLLIVWVFRHMRYSLGQIKKMTESILDGDLKTPVPYGRRDEFLELAGMIDTLRADLHQSNLDKAHLEVERERMLVNITHDIKTPITAIKGCSQMLAEGIVQDEKTKKEYLDIILSRSHVIEHMVNDLKEVIKYDVGSIKLNLTEVNLSYFLEDCIDDFRINNQDQIFDIGFDKEKVNHVIHIDPNLLQRVFKNIIGNALKYNREREVSIHIDTYCVGKTLRFKISDNGVGVPPEALDKLFDRLYRVDSSRNSKIEGSGVGLSICKEIIEAHGGQIWAENIEGAFSILFSIPTNGGQ